MADCKCDTYDGQFRRLPDDLEGSIGSDLIVWTEGDALWLRVDDGSDMPAIQVPYCPLCGRRRAS